MRDVHDFPLFFRMRIDINILVRVSVRRVMSESEASQEVRDVVIVLWENRELSMTRVCLSLEVWESEANRELQNV